MFKISHWLLVISYLLIFPSMIFAHSQTAIIEMTAWGFQPPSATLDNNSTVIFVNKDSKPHWPASDVHPTHDLYPEFDPQRGIEPGESWPFRPKKVGEWRFHDHLNPHQKGTLVVTGEGGVNQGVSLIGNLKANLEELLSKIRNIFGSKFSLNAASFTKLGPNEQIAQLKKYADSQGVEKAWQYIEETFKGQSGSSGNIHDLAHLSGSLLFERLGFGGLAKCSADFAFGCYHGFLDRAFAKSLDKLQDADDACRKLDVTLSGPVASCIHGIGHGVASFYLVSDLNKALSSCRKLISGSEYCFDGVLMEFARSAPENFYKPDDPLYPCNQLEKEFGYSYSSACGRNQPSVLMGRFKMEFPKVVSVCLASASTPFKEACIDSLGFSLAASGEVQQIIQGCQTIGEAQYIKRCVKAAAGELVFQNVPSWDQKSKLVCNSLPDGSDCLQYVERLVSDYHRVR